MSRTIQFFQPPLGMDVELFLSKDKSIVGAEKFIKKPIKIGNNESSKLAKDGVQVELQPAPNHCRANIGREIQVCMNKFNTFLSENNIKADFSGTIEVSEEEFKTLSKESKQFGCDPDFSVYNNCKPNIKISGEETRKRTAGGHIHIGVLDYPKINLKRLAKDCVDCPFDCKIYEKTIDLSEHIKNRKLSIHDFKNDMSTQKEEIIEKICTICQISKKDLMEAIIEIGNEVKLMQSPEILIPLMDVLVGIPSVLLDRDKGAKERRKIYGKAGDFRYQPHGIEYRTLSNFWIKNYTLMHLFLGLARMAYLICYNDIKNGTKYREEILNRVNLKDVQKAINTNNYRLARDIFIKIEDIITDIGDQDHEHYPLYKSNLNAFKEFVLSGYNVFFHGSPISQWISGSQYHPWESWSNNLECRENIEQEFAETELE